MEETMESEKAEAYPDSVSVRRRKLTGRAFKSLLKRKFNDDNVQDMNVLEYSRACSVAREISNISERAQSNCTVVTLQGLLNNLLSVKIAVFLAPVLYALKKKDHIRASFLDGLEFLKKISYNSREKELCTCYDTAHKDLYCSSNCKDGVDQGAVVTLKSAERCQCGNPLKKIHSDLQKKDYGTVCAMCSNDGELLCCEGKDCKRRYHLCCVGVWLPDDLPGVRHCPKCIIKKLEHGVYSVSEGIESIWGVREVDVSNTKETKQRQYLVKYQGLAHIYNHWVPEEQLLLENQSLLSTFITEDKTMSWNLDWTVPHRLLWKRPIRSKMHAPSSADIPESYEWLVKWRGLDYDHATWELDSSYFLNCSFGQCLMKEYENRLGKAKSEVDQSQKGSFVKLLELPDNRSSVNDNFVLENVNKMRESWYNCRNTVVFDDKASFDRVKTLVFFIKSLLEHCHPFLIVATSDSSSQWEAEFARLAPSVSVVVYNGNIDTRKAIRASEFYEEGGRVMLQVLVCSPEAVVEDLEMLSCIRWHSIIIDEYGHSRISTDLEQIKILTTDIWILLLSSEIVDTTSEYLHILSLLDSEHEYNKLRGLRSRNNKNLAKLKERLSRFIAYGNTSKLSKFLEYWVPVHLSSHQVEQYCSTLVSNSMLLRASSRNDKVGAFKDILLTVKKCCDHPYLVSSSIQEQMIAEGHSADTILDVGIKASGKLQLLDMMLAQVKAQELKALILFQSVGLGKSSTGYILNDFLAEKFSQTSYECIFAGVSSSSKKAAVNRFNKKENGKFILLLENRACCSAIKLASLDLVVLYNSDWNPANDYKALQKISIDLDVSQIKVFRLYSSCTVEERALVLAKKNLKDLDNDQTVSRTNGDSLLMWGASYLLRKLDDYHAERTSSSNDISGQSLLDEIAEEFQSILSGCGEISQRTPVISKVKLDVSSYSANGSLLGEAKVELKDEEPHVFWTTLLGKITPQQKHILGHCQRSRKRVHHLENDNTGNKRGNESVADVCRASTPVRTHEQPVIQVGGPEGDSRDDMAGRSPFSPLADRCGAEERNSLVDEQKSIHDLLLEETKKLCQILKLPGDVNHTLRRFLEYIISNDSNDHIWGDSPESMQAFQVSLLRVVASISKQEVNMTDSINLAKTLLNYQCTEEQVYSVYAKMLHLKWMYLQCMNLNDGHLLAGEGPNDGKSSISKGISSSSPIVLQDVKMETEEFSTHEEHREGQSLSQQKLIDVVNEIHRRCNKRMRKLVQKQKLEAIELLHNREVKRLKLETDHQMALALINSIYAEGSERTVKLKVLDRKYAKEMEENKLVEDMQLKDLEARQLSTRVQEREKAAHWILSVKANCSSKLGMSSTLRTPAEAVEANANQPKLIGKVICADLLTSEQKLLDETAPAELNKQVQSKVPENGLCGVVDNVNSEKQTKDKGSGVSPSAAQMLEPLVVQEASLNLCDLLSPQVLEDQSRRSLFVELQDQVPRAAEDKNTSQFEVDPVENINSAQAIENSVQPTNVSTNVASSTRQSTAVEIENQSYVSEENSSRMTKGAETEILPHESSRTGQILEKNFQEAISKLETDREKEMQEVTGQVHRKYKLKLVDAELKYFLRKNVLDGKKTAAVMNQKLPTALSPEYPQSSRLPGIQRGFGNLHLETVGLVAFNHGLEPIFSF
ncbi:chromodomain-helicase-DNA-binding protein [Striga asiatica]|uniref:Chromodomain-helicase-DNA-binding protein n=1 Tax=Striga asiatica TaxID=4170 RepID=A0A5A7PL79_STRAF|nr:chromodomain-helicase-DNA-binding protein [Striga asiatica]